MPDEFSGLDSALVSRGKDLRAFRIFPFGAGIDHVGLNGLIGCSLQGLSFARRAVVFKRLCPCCRL
jgi:hypothetical protein